MRKFFLLLSFLVSIYLPAQNVGIGISNPTDGKLTIVNPSGNQLVTRTSETGTGISLYQVAGYPTIGFNNMLTSSYSYLGAGYGSFLQYSPNNGILKYYSSVASGTANTNIGSTTPTLFSINANGNVGLGVPDAASGLHIRNKSILVENSGGFSDILLNPTYNTYGGGIELQNIAGIRTVAMRASDGTGQSGELMFYNPDDNTSTLELDGDYAGTGRSRIIVDELQIKGGADFAEYFDVAASGEIKPEAGMLVSIDENNEGKLKVSRSAYDKKVAGIISGANGIKAGMIMGHKNTIADGEFPVAITGRVYVNAEAIQTAINPGDLLTTSSLPGYAMKASNFKRSQGAIIGKAMSKLEKGSKGMVLTLLSIQ